MDGSGFFKQNSSWRKTAIASSKNPILACPESALYSANRPGSITRDCEVSTGIRNGRRNGPLDSDQNGARSLSERASEQGPLSRPRPRPERTAGGCWAAADVNALLNNSWAREGRKGVPAHSSWRLRDNISPRVRAIARFAHSAVPIRGGSCKAREGRERKEGRAVSEREARGTS